MSQSKYPEKCSVGEHCESECHLKSYTNIVNLININTLTAAEYQLLHLRSGVSSELLSTICEHHKIYFLKKYETYQTSCLDPFQCHKKKISKTLRTVTIEFCDKINNTPVLKKAVPGQKLCNACREKIQKYKPDKQKEDEIEELELETDAVIDQIENTVRKTKTLEEVNKSLEDLGESPMKFHAIPSHSKSAYVKRKVHSAHSALKSKVCKVLEREFPPEKDVKEIPHEVKKKADDLDMLVDLMKKKLQMPMTRREKIQLLTLAPTSWSRKKVADEFNVSEYSVRKARVLCKEKGLIALPEPRVGKELDQSTVGLVKDFFENDEYSRVMPGKKDKISVSKNVHMQKRLMLSNLNELYVAFKSDYPTIKIGLTKFCMLRPKWCVLAGSSGTHAVCVCAIHQNVKLLLHACSIEETHNDLMNYLVCSKDNRDCMLRHCSECPSNETLKTFLQNKFEEWDPEDEITYSAWVSTDRTQQIQLTVTVEEYVNHLMESLERLLPHSFITKCQSNFLKNLKSTLKPTEAIALLDFSENYSYVIQDEVHGYHWTQDSCSLHPVVIYTREDPLKDLIVSSICILSDDLEHDVAFVYESQKILVQFLKEKFPKVKNVHYFSDGCAAQYKNCKNFLNLCHHLNDFNLEACWSFFATSHGKSPCDGIGGTVKRFITRESLQLDYGNIINSAEKVFQLCKSRIDKIKFFLVRKEELSETRKQAETLLSTAKTVPGTRSFHCFIPLSENVIGAKRVSFDPDYSLIYNFSGGKKPQIINMAQICTNSYVASIYDNHWFFGLVVSKHEEQCDIKIKFMHPYGPASSFYWPQQPDICYVPLHNVICSVETPINKCSGRVFYFSDKDMKTVIQQIQLHDNKQ